MKDFKELTIGWIYFGSVLGLFGWILDWELSIGGIGIVLVASGFLLILKNKKK
jgi:hypothetical protein